jgi:hypothetical protein
MIRERRRSPRLSVRIQLAAEWNTETGTVRQDVVSKSISAWGALLTVTTHHVPADRMILKNVANEHTQSVRVVAVEPSPDRPETYLVRVEFEAAAPEFWGRVYRYGKDEKVELMAVPRRVLS